MVDGMALSCFRPGRPKMMLYGEGARMTVNFIIALRHNLLPPKHTPSSIFPKGLTYSLENPDTVVCVLANLARMDGCSMLKQCLYMISMDAPSSMCILRMRYPSTLASTTNASSERSRANTDKNVIGTFIHLSSVTVVFLFRSTALQFYQIPKLSLAISLSESNHFYCGPFHYDSRSTCSSFLCWVPPLTVLVAANVTGVPWPGFPEGCLPTSSGLRLPCFLSGDENHGWGIVAVHMAHGVPAP
ncbi:hypothetical protein Tco_1188570 [Tanacetum coccineum]